MSIYQKFFVEALDTLHKQGNYRNFNVIDYKNSDFPIAWHYVKHKNVTVWCTNNYLGMSKNVDVMDAAKRAIDDYGVGAGGTRNISGSHSSIFNLELDIAALHNKEAALVFTSGYIANQASIGIIGKLIPGCVIFSDEMNHASMIHGIKDSGCKKYIFKHNDTADLKRIISLHDPNLPKLIIFESVYSMNGSIAPIADIVDIAQEYNAMTYLDEVHAVGLYGPKGGGVAQMLGLESKLDIIQGNFAKGYGVIGGYIASDTQIVDAVRSFAPSFIFTTTLPPHVTESCRASIRHLKHSDKERIALHENVRKVKSGLLKAGLDVLENPGHIVPIMLYDPFLANQFSSILLDECSIYAQHINYPTVPKGTERLRITPTPMHTDAMINELIDACVYVSTKLGLKKRKTA